MNEFLEKFHNLVSNLSNLISYPSEIEPNRKIYYLESNNIKERIDSLYHSFIAWIKPQNYYFPLDKKNIWIVPTKYGKIWERFICYIYLLAFKGRGEKDKKEKEKKKYSYPP